MIALVLITITGFNHSYTAFAVNTKKTSVKSSISDFETEFPLLLLANAGFAIAIDDTIIPIAAIASIAKVVVFVIFVVFIIFIILCSFTQ
jgi:hypothetical protein